MPVIAAEADHLTVFQRTANYSVPARNGPLSDEFKAYVRENFDEIRKTVQSTPNGHPFRIAERSVFDVSEAERQEIYEAAWEKGGLQFRAAFGDLLADKKANDTAKEFLCNKIREIVKDPETAEKLANIDHPYAAKRPPIDTDYFETYNRDNVDLVDVRADPIVEITPTGIRLQSGAEYELDVIVFATGFDAMTGALLSLNITGRDGMKLQDAWAAGPRNYLGLGVAGFPNLFTITGPGSPSVLCNMPVPIEQHVEWISDCIDYMRANGISPDRADRRGGRGMGFTRQRGGQQDLAAAGRPFLVSRRECAGQAACLHAVCRRHGDVSRKVRRGGGGRLRGLQARTRDGGGEIGR